MLLKKSCGKKGKDLESAGKVNEESNLLNQIIHRSSTPEVTFSGEKGSKCPAVLDREALALRAEHG